LVSDLPLWLSNDFLSLMYFLPNENGIFLNRNAFLGEDRVRMTIRRMNFTENTHPLFKEFRPLIRHPVTVLPRDSPPYFENTSDIVGK